MEDRKQELRDAWRRAKYPSKRRKNQFIPTPPSFTTSGIEMGYRGPRAHTGTARNGSRFVRLKNANYVGPYDNGFLAEVEYKAYPSGDITTFEIPINKYAGSYDPKTGHVFIKQSYLEKHELVIFNAISKVDPTVKVVGIRFYEND